MYLGNVEEEHFENCCSNFVLGGANVRGIFEDFYTLTEKILALQGFKNIKENVYRYLDIPFLGLAQRVLMKPALSVCPSVRQSVTKVLILPAISFF